MSQSLFKNKVLLVHRHAHSFTYCLSMAAFIFTTADLVLTETVWLAKHKTSTIWPYRNCMLVPANQYLCVIDSVTWRHSKTSISSWMSQGSTIFNAK